MLKADHQHRPSAHPIPSHPNQDDLRMWLQYLDFCAAVKSTRVQSRIFAAALRLHGKHPGLWYAGLN